MKKVRETIRPFRFDLNQVPYDYTVEVTNRFKGLDLIDRLPEEYCTGGRDQDPKKKKCKKANWLSDEDLQIAKQRREAKSKKKKKKGKIYASECSFKE